MTGAQLVELAVQERAERLEAQRRDLLERGRRILEDIPEEERTELDRDWLTELYVSWVEAYDAACCDRWHARD